MEVIFAHNTHNRVKTLTDTVLTERILYPESKVYISYTENGGLKPEKFDQITNTKILKTIAGGWQSGCINAFYNLASTICNDYDDGIIIFSHDDVHIKKFSVVTDNINKMLAENLAYILRRPSIEKYGKNYFMMEAVYLRVSHVKEVFNKINNELISEPDLIPRDILGHASAETWLSSMLSEIDNGLVIDYPHSKLSINGINENLTTEMGYNHINLGKTGWRE